MEKIITHKDAYNFILDTFSKNNIEFIILRGFIHLPKKPDTDLDIVINSKDYDKFINILNKLKDDEIIKMGKKKIYKKNDKEFYYLPFFTHSKFKESEKLPNKCFRFDTYSDLFFFESKNEGYLVNQLFINYLFKNKIKISNYFIPDPISEILLLVFRNLYDKNGKWKNKHKNRILKLISNIDEKEFKYVQNFFYYDDILEKLKNKNFNLINKPDKELILFIIRKIGLKKDIIDFVIENMKIHNYQIIDIINVGFDENNKFLKNFYNNFDIYEDDILKINGNKCLCIVTNYQKNVRPRKLKNFIRSKYKELAPPMGNIIHSSDSPEDCDKELKLLFDENYKSFKKIGTYYSQKNNGNY